MKCEHPEGYSRTKYVGGEFKSGVFYCRDCKHGFHWTKEDMSDRSDIRHKETSRSIRGGKRYVYTLCGMTDKERSLLGQENLARWEYKNGNNVNCPKCLARKPR